MLQTRHKDVTATISREQLRIWSKELHLYHDTLTESGIALGGTLVAECAFLAVLTLGYSASVNMDDEAEIAAATGSTRRYLHAIFVVLSVCTTCLGVQCVVVCASASAFGPGLALRGAGGEHDLRAAITGMKQEKEFAFKLLVAAVVCLESSVLPLAWIRLRTPWAASVVCTIVVLCLTLTYTHAVRRVDRVFEGGGSDDSGVKEDTAVAGPRASKHANSHGRRERAATTTASDENTSRFHGEKVPAASEASIRRRNSNRNSNQD